MLPKYPEFKKLELKDQQAIERHTKGLLPYSDFNFTSLWAWNTNNDAEISALNNNLVLKFADYISGRPFLTTIGKQNLDYTLEQLCKDAQDAKISRRLHLVPEEVAKNISNRGRFYIRADRANHDYIIDLREFVNLAGNKKRSKRFDVRKFQQIHKDYAFRIVSMAARKVQQQIIDLMDHWRKSRVENPEEADNEYEAVRRLLQSSNHIQLTTFGLYIDGRLKAFEVCELLPGQYVMGHFFKADINHVGISNFLAHKSALRLLKMGARYLNEEQDLGLPGLRKSKLLHRPVKFLRKYFISLRK